MRIEKCRTNLNQKRENSRNRLLCNHAVVDVCNNTASAEDRNCCKVLRVRKVRESGVRGWKDQILLRVTSGSYDHDFLLRMRQFLLTVAFPCRFAAPRSSTSGRKEKRKAIGARARSRQADDIAVRRLGVDWSSKLRSRSDPILQTTILIRSDSEKCDSNPILIYKRKKFSCIFWNLQPILVFYLWFSFFLSVFSV